MANGNDSSNTVAIFAIVIIVVVFGFLVYYFVGMPPKGEATKESTTIVQPIKETIKETTVKETSD